MATFTLTIELGNDAMQDGLDLSRALQEVAYQLAPDGYGSAPDAGESYPIKDVDGNTVGRWEMSA